MTAIKNKLEIPFDRWPLCINPKMDEDAADQGLSHWSCVSPNSNEWWVRMDGTTFEPFEHPKIVGEDYGSVLRGWDKACPLFSMENPI